MSKVSEYIDNLFYLVPRTDAAAEIRQKLIERPSVALIEKADRVLYRAKRMGKGICCLSED